MKHYDYVEEISPARKIKVFVWSIISFMVLLFLIIFFFQFWYSLIKKTPILYGLIKYLEYNLINTTPIGLFYSHVIGGLFFMPSADEFVFYYGLLSGNLIVLSFLAAVVGYMLAQLFNYFMGLKMSNFILHIVSKKKVYQAKRWINKYGVYGIFVFNILPLPAPLLVFALGVTKYNFKRLFIVMGLAKIVEYSALIGLFLLLSK